MPVKNRLADLQPEIAGWRRALHADPELAFEEHRTAARVADLLRGFGCDSVDTDICGTAVVAVIRGRNGGAGRAVALRADMDALPIAEATGAAHASQNAGVMHACGHDGHTAMLLGAARYLAETRRFDGTAVLIFQPAEEAGTGARALCKAGVMERYGVDEIYGLHNMPGLPAGQFAIRAGAMMAATDEFRIDLTGRGGHAAEPHETVDPTVVACHLVVALQTVVSRNADPVENAVLSVTSVDTASHAFNVIPQAVRLRGTVRSHSPAQQDVIERRLAEIAAGIAASFGATARVDYIRHVPVTLNPPETAAWAAEAARAVAGDCAEAPLIMGGEDFSFMLAARPGAFIFLGNGDGPGLHHPAYDFNDASIAAGCSWLAEMIERRMPAA